MGQSELEAAASRKAVWWDLRLASLLTHLLFFFRPETQFTEKPTLSASTDDTRRDACMHDVSCEIIAMLLFFVDFYCFCDRVCAFVTFPNKYGRVQFIYIMKSYAKNAVGHRNRKNK